MLISGMLNMGTKINLSNCLKIAVLVSTLIAGVAAAMTIVHYVIPNEIDPLPPNITVRNVDDVSCFTSEDGYQYQWNINIPIYVRIIARNPSDISLENFSFVRNEAIDSILVSGMADKTDIDPILPYQKRVLPTDSDVSIELPVVITAWVQGGYGLIYGKITKERLGTITFNVTITDLTTGKSDTKLIEKNVFWVRDESVEPLWY